MRKFPVFFIDDLLNDKNSFQEKSLTNIHPTITLDYKVFRKVYANKMEVLEANELSVIPTTSYPCINVRMQSEDMYEISSSSSTNLHSWIFYFYISKHSNFFFLILLIFRRVSSESLMFLKIFSFLIDLCIFFEE